MPDAQSPRYEAPETGGGVGAEKDDSMVDSSRPELAVEDVLAVVEEMTMLH